MEFCTSLPPKIFTNGDRMAGDMQSLELDFRDAIGTSILWSICIIRYVLNSLWKYSKMKICEDLEEEERRLVICGKIM